METERLSLTTAWTPILTDGGSCIIQRASSAIEVRVTEDAAPAADAHGLLYERHQTQSGVGFNNLPAGTRLFVRASRGAASVSVVK